MKISRRLALLLITVWGGIVLTGLATAGAASTPEEIDQPTLAQADSSGAPVTQAFCNEIGADGYAPDAASAADLAKKLLK
jgi:hypothetical protein